ncbi:LruC domain-containing protein [uncultured Bacteroides sp.]|uniref:LruC domain-containing protein n=2 Tax=uncultured Bacteroides sp. TaxID=162156 RepID=UPI0025DA8F8C|nr:LruC domain-containing protein [uncultured Bacteroides sp.]
MRNFLFSTKVLTILAVYAFGGYVLTSCVDRDTDYSRPDSGSMPNSFDFNTMQEVQLNVKYELPEYVKNEDYEILFEIYFENPFKKDTVIVKNNDVKSKLTRMTDGSGKYNGKEVIPGYLLNEGQEVYIYTSCIGVPQLYRTTVSGNSIQADINWNTMYDFDSMPQTRAESNYTITDGFYTLGDWDAKGRPGYLTTEGELELSTSLLETINKTIPEGGSCPKKYRQEVDIEVKQEANLKVRFIGGTSDASSAFGYYCYKYDGSDDNELRKIVKAAKKCIVFPNTKTGVGIKGGECVQLRYIDEKGVYHDEFPEGVKIGWFISNNAFKNGNIEKGAGMFYSTQRMNGDDRRHTAAFSVGKFIVLSFEDWHNQDYNDVQFNILSDPIEAIIDSIPPVPPVPPVDGDSVAYRMTYKGIVAFEDKWPSKGDYDLNDVVVKYKSVLDYNIKNEVLATKDTFTAYWSGAEYRNSFIYQLNTERTNVESSMKMDQDLSLATIPVFMDMREATGDNNTKTPEVAITNKFKTPIDHEVFGVAPYNPFISVFKTTGYDRREVHMVNYKPTDKAKKSLFHTESDLSDIDKGIYYVSDSKYPFAINLPDAEEYSTTEKESVDKTFPRFVPWVESNGTKDKDWYLKK